MPRRFRGAPPTRFAELLMNYMWSQRPPLDQRQLAERIGVSPNAVHGWLSRGILPRNLTEMAPKISMATGIPQSALYEAIGMRLPGEPSVPALPPRIVEVDRFGELINDMRHQPRLTPAQKWFAIEAAYERHYGLDRPREWIEAEHDVTVAPTEPSLPAIGTQTPSPLDRPRTNTETNPAQNAADEAARTDGIAK